MSFSFRLVLTFTLISEEQRLPVLFQFRQHSSTHSISKVKPSVSSVHSSFAFPNIWFLPVHFQLTFVTFSFNLSIYLALSRPRWILFAKSKLFFVIRRMPMAAFSFFPVVFLYIWWLMRGNCQENKIFFCLASLCPSTAPTDFYIILYSNAPYSFSLCWQPFL